ncbi:Histone chaperone ASF1 [Neolecta irregularis DAH-3]|uniref:Anti-silencing function protein 1 n=1 Tax=Neolecta irregularis (strain DAH-3) TaxID=1198029 RepID=A0A1U7LMI1_NEOID|nr:Histone chaperone ASF1 [Neolecta irregularis DAH-3]|eukprot:OLL23876.1 Histone chaperone ASF1 [Neolecta irregularis DAH-3]
MTAKFPDHESTREVRMDAAPILPSAALKYNVVNVLQVKVLNNPAPFSAPYEFEITFECLEKLQHDLEWKLTYVGSAASTLHDQVLDSLLVGPIPIGVNKFVFSADPPATSKIPLADVLGVTVILLTCTYDEREFVRIGYYVNNEYESEELRENPPEKPILEKMQRNILAEKPRVTRVNIKWYECIVGCMTDFRDNVAETDEFPPEQPFADEMEDDEEKYGAEEKVEEDPHDVDREDVADKMETDEPVASVSVTTALVEEPVSDNAEEDLEGESSEEDLEADEELDGEEEVDRDDNMKENIPETNTNEKGKAVETENQATGTIIA